ncbi:MAG: TPM domain-containing protein [Chitinophagales bacterium]
MGKSIENFFNKKEKESITNAIRNAEEQTTGEVRIRIESSVKDTDVFECARKDFEELGMHKTKHRNGVLLYIAINDKQFAIIGDINIDAIVGQKYWHNLSITLEEYFSRKQFAEGTITVVNRIGEILHQYFPIKDDEENNDELPNEISFGD